MVSVFAIAVDYVDETPELYEELNEINTRYWGAKAYFSVGFVVIHYAIPAEGLTAGSLDYVVQCVQYVADTVGPVLESEHGGETPIRPVEDVVDER